MNPSNPSNTAKRPANSPMPSRAKTDEFIHIPEQATGKTRDSFSFFFIINHLSGLTQLGRGKRMMSEKQRDQADVIT